jgi:membrane-associated phospholipid phosphatase
MKFILPLFLILVPALYAADAEQKYAWDESWPRFRTSEYVVTGLSAVGAAANFYWVTPPQSPSWKGEILFDKSARNTLLIHSGAAHDGAINVSDLLTYSLVGYGMLDGPVTALVGKNKDTATQLALINAETFAVTEFLNLSVSNLMPRSRPEGDVCPLNSQYDPHCVKSFWSGHAANVFAAAALVCTEHGAVELYGGKADTAACATSLAAASAVGVLRIATNDHHASDVIVGAVIGAATGYLMPNLLHFKFKRRRRDLGYLIPSGGIHGGGLTYVKAW